MRSWRPRATRSRSALRSPRTSSAAAETLATASASGSSAGSPRAPAGRDFLAGDDDDPLQALRRIEARRERLAPRRADHEAAVDRRRDVVGMALDLGRPRQQLLPRQRQLEEMVGGRQPGDDRRRARPEPPRQRDLRAQLERDPVGRSAASRTPARSGCPARSTRRAHPDRARTPPSLRPPAPGAAPSPPPSRRTPARGWPRRRERVRVGGGWSSQKILAAIVLQFDDPARQAADRPAAIPRPVADVAAPDQCFAGVSARCSWKG